MLLAAQRDIPTSIQAPTQTSNIRKSDLMDQNEIFSPVRDSKYKMGVFHTELGNGCTSMLNFVVNRSTGLTTGLSDKFHRISTLFCLSHFLFSYIPLISIRSIEYCT